MPIPLELVTMLGSSIFGGVMSIWSQSLKAKAQAHSEMVQALDTRGRLVQAARAYAAKNPSVQFTKRALALMSVFAVIVLPKLVAVFWPEVLVTVGYTQFQPGFWPFTGGKEVVVWQVAKGLTLTPLDTHFVSAVAGMYFGASIVKDSR